MTSIHRRSCMKAAAAAAFAAAVNPAALAQSAKNPWKKAFMLGGLTKGSPLPVFKKLREAGFEGVELISPSQLEQSEVLEARDQTGLKIHGVSGGLHWQCPLSDPDPAIVAQGLQAVRQEFVDCKAYGGDTVLLVPAVVNRKVTYRDAYKRSRANIEKLLPDAEKHGIKIAIEEVWNKFLLSPIEFARYIDDFKSPWVGAYFDVGNIVEYGFPEQWIQELGTRILKIHVKEYSRARRFDCKLGEGDIDWSAVAKALASTGYKGWITAEVGLGDLAEMKDVTSRMDALLNIG